MNMSSVLQTPLLREPGLDGARNNKMGNGTQEGSLFQAVLLKNMPNTEKTNGQETMETEDMEVRHNLANWIQVIQQLLGGSENQSIPFVTQELPLDEDMNWTQEEMQALVSHLLEDSTGLDFSAKEELLTMLNSGEAIDASILQDVMAAFMQSEGSMMRAYQRIMEKATNILQMMQTSGEMEKQSQELLRLMQEWNTVSQKQGVSGDIMKAVLANGESSDEQVIWKELITAYQKRNQFVQNKRYHTSAQVTRKDITKWLQQLIPNSQQTGDKVVVHQQVGFQSAQMTHVEQYVIHLEQGNQTESPNKQLMDQFQKIIHSSRFLTNTSGTNQLSLSLRPENLGDMMVKLTQVNGELTARILVSSHAAKEMLEANLHQLKHMFSPHQVVIERTDVNVTSQEAMNEEGEDSHAEEGEQGHPDESSEQQNDSREDDFAAHMEELLWNTKV